MSEKFDREYELEGDKGVLIFSQLEKGDVNCVVWDAALVLAKYIEVRFKTDPDSIKNKRVLELGTGLGCVGLVAACYGGRVTLTDQPKALPLLEYNITINKETLARLNSEITAKSLDWNDECSEEPYDLLLMADCIYYKESIDPLINVLKQLTSEKTIVILCQEDRSYSDIQKRTWEEFKSRVGEHFTISDIPSSDQHPQFNSSDIFLFQLKKK